MNKLEVIQGMIRREKTKKLATENHIRILMLELKEKFGFTSIEKAKEHLKNLKEEIESEGGFVE